MSVDIFNLVRHSLMAVTSSSVQVVNDDAADSEAAAGEAPDPDGSLVLQYCTVQLDRVQMILEVMVRSSAPHAPPTTLRAFFDSPG